jgi:hypothetical protein
LVTTPVTTLCGGKTPRLMMLSYPGGVRHRAPAAVELRVVPVDLGAALAFEGLVVEPGQVAAAAQRARDRRQRDDEVGAEVGGELVDQPVDARLRHGLLDVQVETVQPVRRDEVLRSGTAPAVGAVATAASTAAAVNLIALGNIR